MADYIYPFGDAPDDAEYVLGEANQDLPNGLVILPGPGIQIQQGPGTITITNTGGGDTTDQTYWTADDETSTLPNSFRVLAGSNVSLTYGAGTVTISASGGGGGGGVSSVSAGNAAGLFTTNVSNPTTTPNITFNVVSNIINDLASATGIGILTSTDGVYHAFRTIQGTAGEINVTNGSGAGGNPTLSLDSSVYTNRDSSVLNALATGLSGTGFVSQNGAQFYDRTLTGTSGRLTVSNGTGATGDPVFDVGPQVFTVSTSNTLNALASTTGNGFVTLNSPAARTITGTPNRITVANGTGASGDPTIDLGTDVLVVGDVTALSGIQIVNGSGVIQVGASGALGGTLTNLTVGDVSPVWTTNVSNPTTAPNVTFTLNNFASGALLIGPKTGSASAPTVRRLLGQDIYDAVTAGSNVTLSLVGDQLVISSTASGGGGGTVTRVTSQNLPPLFTTTVNTDTTTPDIQYTFSNVASANFLAGPASGPNGPWINRGILGTDLTGALQAGANITITQSTPPNSRLVIAITGQIDASLIANGSVDNTEFQYLNGVTSGIQGQLDSKQPLSGVLNALSTGLSGTGYVIQTGPTSFAERSITSANSNHISITNGDGVAGATSIGVGPQVYTFSSSNVLNDLATSTSTGIVVQSNSAGEHSYRTIQGSTGYITVTNGNGTAGDPSLSIGNRVFTDSTSNILNALSSSTSGSTGLLTQLSDNAFVDRTIVTANSSHLTVTNGSGVAGNPTLDIGANVYTNENYSLLNYLASTTPSQGQIAMGQSDGSLIYAKPNAGAGVQLSFSNGVFTIAASGANGGTITQAYQTVQEEGSNLTQRNTLNFIGGGVIAADDSGNSRTNVTLDSTLNALAAYNTAGILTQTAADTFTGRTITGTSGNITIVNGDGVSGNPTVNVGANVYTRSDSSVLNALATGVNGTGFVAQNGASFADRTLTGTGNRLTITNGTGATGNPVFDVGPDVYTISSSNVLNDLASSTSTGVVVQTDSVGHHAYRTLTGTANEVTVTNGDGVSGNPTFSLPTGINVTKLADGSVDNTEFQYLNGVTSNIQTQLDSKLVSAGDLSPLFTTNESAGNIAFTFNNVASANFLRGPASGSSGPWVAGGILGTDLTGALEAGSNITIAQAPAPGSRLIISSTGSTGYSTIQEEGSNLTQRSTINFIGGGVTAADDSGNARTNVTLDATLNSLAAYNTNGLLTQTAPDTFTGRTITGTSGNVTVTNGDGVSGNPTLDVGANVYTRSQSSLLNYLASTAPSQGQIPMGKSDGNYELVKPNAGSGIQLDFANGVFTISATGAGSGITQAYQTIQEEGSPLTQRSVLDIVGNALTASDTGAKTQLTAHTSVNSIAVTPTNGQLPIGNGTNFTVAAPTAGTGIEITLGSGVLNIASSGALGGTVRDFSAGDLSPLFTTSEATTTTTPALSFTLMAAASGTAYMGPDSGADASPSFKQINPGRIVNNYVNMGLFIDGASAVISSGEVGVFPVDFNGTVAQWDILGLQSGSCTFNVYKSTYSSYPSMTSMIGAGTKPAVSSTTKNQGNASTWDTSTITAGDIIKVVLESNTSFQGLTFAMKVLRTS